MKQLSRGGCSAIHKDFLTGQFCPCLANVDHDVVVDLLLVVDRDVDFECCSAIHYDFLTGQFFNVYNDVLIAIDMLVLVDLDIGF